MGIDRLVRRALRQRALAAMLVFGSGGIAAAQETVLQPTSQYAEVILEHPKVSGGRLVGLRWTSPDGAFRAQSVGVYVAGLSGAGRVCVGVASQDGLYTAENTYDVPNGASPLSRFHSETRHPRALEKYPTNEIAVIIRESESCGAVKTKGYLPAILLPNSGIQNSPDQRELLAFVNADPEQVELLLIGHDGNRLATGACRKAEASTYIAYSTRCTIGVPANPPAQVTLRLMLKERFRSVPIDYNLLLR